jgi:hypothetical protein
MRHLKRLVRFTAFITLLAATATTTAVWHAGEDDAACLTVLSSERDGSPRTIGSTPQQREPQHCLLCHWNRWVRSVPTAGSHVVAPAQDAARLIVQIFVGETRSACGLTPGRAPPA